MKQCTVSHDNVLGFHILHTIVNNSKLFLFPPPALLLDPLPVPLPLRQQRRPPPAARRPPPTPTPVLGAVPPAVRFELILLLLLDDNVLDLELPSPSSAEEESWMELKNLKYLLTVLASWGENFSPVSSPLRSPAEIPPSSEAAFEVVSASHSSSRVDSSSFGRGCVQASITCKWIRKQYSCYTQCAQ